jgi:hypothetical protein
MVPSLADTQQRNANIVKATDQLRNYDCPCSILEEGLALQSKAPRLSSREATLL